MNHFPIFLATEGRRFVLSGGDDAALAKLRLLLRTRAQLTVFATDPAREILEWAESGKLRLVRRAMEPGDALCAALVYAADEDPHLDAQVAQIARMDGALVNIVDNLSDSQFITPAIVDRDPVTVAIGTEGAAPVLARAIKADLESRLPTRLGTLARIGKAFRKAADALPFGRARRDFWRDYYFNAGPRALERSEDAVEPELFSLLNAHLSRDARDSHVAFVGAGPGDPDLLTLKARKALDEAEVVIHDRLVTPEILELARREATLIDVGKTGFGPSTRQSDINALLVAHARDGAQVVRLKGGDPAIFARLDEEIEALDAAGIGWSIVPGITAASAAAASIGQGLTRRGRNASVRFLTGHDVSGFTDHDWSALAASDDVAAIYMGKKAARFMQGRLLMHGAAPQTPVTVVANVSRPDQRILSTSLQSMEPTITAAKINGPALVLFRLEPRRMQEVCKSVVGPLQSAVTASK